MSATDETKPDAPDNARPLKVGEIIEDGDLHWNKTVRHWVEVTPQGEERVQLGQDGFYYRKNADL